jgi:hypothetical protein
VWQAEEALSGSAIRANAIQQHDHEHGQRSRFAADIGNTEGRPLRDHQGEAGYTPQL